METWLPNFTEEVQRLLGYSATTANAYASDIRLFIQYLQRQGKPIPPDLTPEDVIGFLESEARQGRRRSTVYRRLAALRVLERCLLHTQRIESPFVPPEGQLMSILDASHPSEATACLSTEDLRRLWAVVQQSPKRQARRDLALMALMAEWGFPVNTILDMELRHVDLEEGRVWVAEPSGVPKGWKIPHAVVPLRMYIERYRGELSPKPGETHVFISQQGRPLSRQSVWHSLQRWGEAAQLDLRLTPRVLRVTAAYRLLRAGVPQHTIGVAMGHHNPLSTHLLIRRLERHCAQVAPAEIPTLK